MSASVRIPRRTAVAMLEILETGRGSLPQRALDELRRATLPSPKRKAAKATRAKVRTAKRATRKEEMNAIREAVFERAQGKCEFCYALPAVDPHHAFGRVRVKQSVRNCFAVCRACHNDITGNKPSAAYWAERQAERFELFGFMEEARRMRAMPEARGMVKQARALSDASAVAGVR